MELLKGIKKSLKQAVWINCCFLLLFISCVDTASSRIPYVVTDKYINLTIDNELLIPGNSMLFTGSSYCGYGGIIVCCIGLNEYVAFDAACPNEANPSVVLKLNGMTATCPSCKTQYLLTTGTPVKGPSPYALKAYSVLVSQGSLHISN